MKFILRFKKNICPQLFYKTKIRFILILFISCMLCSCIKKSGSVNYGEFPAEIGRIIGNKCAVSGCHNSLSYLAASEYNMESWLKAFEGSNNGSPIVPYSSKFSSLCSFINTYPELGIENYPTMPLNKKPLSLTEVKTIKDWIDAGAPDLNGNVMWADNPLRKKLYAVNQGCDVVTVFDSETQLPMRYIEVGRPGSSDIPHQVRVSPDGKYWYVIFVNYNVMEKHRCSDDAFVANIPLTPLAAGTGTVDAVNWNTFIISSDSKRAYTVCWQTGGFLSSVNLETESLINFIGGLSNPHASALNRDNTILYIGAQQGNYITAWNTDFSTYLDISLDGNPISQSPSLDIHDIHLDSLNNRLFITCQRSNQVKVFNINSSNVDATIPVGNTPQEIVYSKSKQQYFVSCPEDVITFPGSKGVITRINANNFTDIKSIKCGYQPHGIAVDDSKKLLYVLSRNIFTAGPAPHHSSACGRNGFVNFIDLNTFTVLPKKFELSSDPYFIFARP